MTTHVMSLSPPFPNKDQTGILVSHLVEGTTPSQPNVLQFSPHQALTKLLSPRITSLPIGFLSPGDSEEGKITLTQEDMVPKEQTRVHGKV